VLTKLLPRDDGLQRPFWVMLTEGIRAVRGVVEWREEGKDENALQTVHIQDSA